jgi:hypothetical protein
MATVPQAATAAADLLQHVEASVVADRTCKTHEAVRHALMAALWRADRQPESSTVVDVACVLDSGLARYEVLGAGRTSYADLRSGAARLLETDHASPARADRLYLVLSAAPTDAWSAEAIRDVFAVEVLWRTPGGWEGSAAQAALGAS